MQQYNWRHLSLSILITSLRRVVVASTVHRYTTAIHLLRLFTLSVPFQPTIEKSSNNSVSSLPIQKTSSLSSPSSQHWHHILSRNPTARHNGNLNPAPLTEPQNGNCQSSASSYSPPSLPHKIHISLTLHTSCSSTRKLCCEISMTFCHNYAKTPTLSLFHSCSFTWLLLSYWPQFLCSHLFISNDTSPSTPTKCL